MFFRKKKPKEFFGVIPQEYAIEIAELHDKYCSLPRGVDHLARMKLWSRIYEIFPRLNIEKTTTIRYIGAVSVRIVVSAADYSESPFNNTQQTLPAAPAEPGWADGTLETSGSV